MQLCRLSGLQTVASLRTEAISVAAQEEYCCHCESIDEVPLRALQADFPQVPSKVHWQTHSRSSTSSRGQDGTGSAGSNMQRTIAAASHQRAWSTPIARTPLRNNAQSLTPLHSCGSDTSTQGECHQARSAWVNGDVDVPGACFRLPTCAVICRVLNAASEGIGNDTCTECSRIWRAPGTQTPSPRSCECTSRRRVGNTPPR